MNPIIGFEGRELIEGGVAICGAGCGQLCEPGATLCPDCAPVFVGHQYARTASKSSSRLESAAWISAALAVFWYLIWCFRDFILQCFYMWFGSGLR